MFVLTCNHSKILENRPRFLILKKKTFIWKVEWWGMWGRQTHKEIHLPSAGSLPNCQQWPGLAHTDVRSLELHLRLSPHMAGPQVFMSSFIAFRVQQEGPGWKTEQWGLKTHCDMGCQLYKHQLNLLHHSISLIFWVSQAENQEIDLGSMHLRQTRT